MGLDNTDTFEEPGNNPADSDNISSEYIPEQEISEEKQETLEAKKTPKKSEFRFIFYVLFAVLFIVIVAVIALMFTSQPASHTSKWEKVEPPATKPAAELSDDTSAGARKIPSAMDDPNDKHLAELDSNHQTQSVPGLSTSELTQAMAQDNESESDAQSPRLTPVTKVPSSVSQMQDQLDELTTRIEVLEKHQKTTENSSLEGDVRGMQQQLQRQENALMGFQSQLITIQQKQVATPHQDVSKKVDGLNKQLAKLKKLFDGLSNDVEDHGKDIKWISHTRVCALEKAAGIERWSKYCGFTKSHPNHKTKPKREVSLNNEPSEQAIQQAKEVVNENGVPQTITTQDGRYPVANVLATGEITNACQYRSRNWTLSLLSSHEAMITRNSDQFTSRISVGSVVPGLGRVQYFKFNGYPQYVQLTGGIICGN